MQWASHVIGFSSQASKTAYSADQVLGPPNKFPAYGDCGCAWTPKSGERATPEYIKVGFAKPQRLRQVILAENLNPGAITRVAGYDYQSQEVILYERGEAEHIRSRGRLFHIEVPKTKFKIASLRVEMDPQSAAGSNQIDAIGITLRKDPVRIQIEHFADLTFYGQPRDLGSGVNTAYSEIMPRFSPDGKQLFFNRKDHPSNYGGFINDDIWLSTQDQEGRWLPAGNMSSPLNNGWHNYVCGVSHDGVLTLANHYYDDGGTKPGISQSFIRSGSSRYIPPLNLHIPQLYTGGLYAEYFMNRDRTVLLLAIEPLDSRGGRDLYVSFTNDGISWTRPKNLGDAVNSAGQEMAPFLMPDDETLYYSSDGHRGYGEHDIFRSKRLDDSWENWSEPENLGPAINTEAWESHFVIDPAEDWAYFATTRDEFGNSDLLRVSLRELDEEEPEAKPALEEASLAEGTPPEEPTSPAYPFKQELLVFGYLRDGSTGQYLRGELNIRQADNPSAFVELSTINAQYQLKVAEATEYIVEVRSEGYQVASYELIVENKGENAVRRRDFELFPNNWQAHKDSDEIILEQGTVVRMKTLHFSVNSAVIRSESYAELDRLLAAALKNDHKLTIEGHTNTRCEKKFCERLSRSRARRVAKYLIDNGVDAKRISWKGYGKEFPIAPDGTEAGQKLNQRVEVRVG